MWSPPSDTSNAHKIGPDLSWAIYSIAVFRGFAVASLSERVSSCPLENSVAVALEHLDI